MASLDTYCGSNTKFKLKNIQAVYPIVRFTFTFETENKPSNIFLSTPTFQCLTCKHMTI